MKTVWLARSVVSPYYSLLKSMTPLTPLPLALARQASQITTYFSGSPFWRHTTCHHLYLPCRSRSSHQQRKPPLHLSANCQETRKVYWQYPEISNADWNSILPRFQSILPSNVYGYTYSHTTFTNNLSVRQSVQRNCPITLLLCTDVAFYLLCIL